MTYFNATGIKDVQTSKQVWVDEFNSLRTNPVTRLVGTPFVGNTKDANFWTETDANGGTVSQSSGSITLATNTSANGTAQYQTTKNARWVTGAENTFRTILRVGDTGAANNTRNWGAFSTTDGFFFQLTGTTLNIVSRFNSSDTAVPKASWNVSSSFTLDTNYHSWEIRMTYADIHFYIDHILVHTLKPTTAFFSQTLSLPVTLQNNNSGGNASNYNLYIGVAFISRTGSLATEVTYYHLTTAGTATLKYGAGRLHKIISGTSTGTGITLYDNTAANGSVISVIGNPANNNPYYLDYGVPFSNGLTVVSTGTWDVTIIYE